MSWAIDMFQKFSICLHSFMLLPIGVLIAAIMVYWLLYGTLFLKLLTITYCFYLYWDYDTPFNGGRRWRFFCQNPFLNSMADYFSIKVVKTAELPSDRNYLAGCHPHAIMFYSWWLATATDVTNFSFKNKINLFLCTLNSNFVFPLSREYFLAQGLISAAERSIKPILSKPGGGNMVCITPGAAAEAEFAQPRKYHLLLKKRKGFCRVALETGASLLPVLAFNEVDCWEIDKHYWLSAWVQSLITKFTGYNFVLYKRPGSTWYFGLPMRKPITVVFGSPIHLNKIEKPTKEEINQLQGRYIESLQQLFEQEKHKYITNADDVHLTYE